MDQAELFGQIDDYIERLFVREDAALTQALADSKAAGLPPIQVSAAQGKLLYLLARLARAERILEIGTLGGYSSIWLGRALPAGGKLITLEYSPLHAEVAAANIARAGLADKVEILLGAAAETLPTLQARGEAPFDVIFLDADKQGYPVYLDWALRLSRPGTLLLADNVIREGRVMAPPEGDDSAQGASRFNDLLAAEDRVEAVALQTVGAKSHDGIAIALVR